MAIKDQIEVTEIAGELIKSFGIGKLHFMPAETVSIQGLHKSGPVHVVEWYFKGPSLQTLNVVQ